MSKKKAANKTPEPRAMLCLIATKETQGRRANDFYFATEGERVYPPVIRCTGEKPDDSCGCARCFSGVISTKSTTTARVFECYEKTLIDERAAFLVKSWSLLPIEARREAKSAARAMDRALQGFMPGAVVEIRGNKIIVRTGRP